ncbi:MAG: hypothetical protein KJ634_11575 [Gammaproteobacteria bacterium]|nr:hypothetical protein [Gammaproteobacteria bacterium]MBU1416255.1 hypothetical protein [Gammaproteobacteria bacterium]
MSKLIRDLKEAEQRRKAEDDQLAADREGEAAALAWLADEANGTARATEIRETQREALEVARRRAKAEAAAIEQARARLKADIAARTLTAERIALERDNERLARQRQEAEEQALAEARRREQAAADLRDAIAARLKRETEALAVAEARAQSEQAAVQAANEKTQMERSLEAVEMSRVAAERDAADLAKQRGDRENEAAQAKAARREVQAHLRQMAAQAHGPSTRPAGLDQPTVQMDSSNAAIVDQLEDSAPSRRGYLVPGVALAALLLGTALGWLVATESQPPATAVVAAPAPLPATTPAPPPATLRLETDAEAFGRRVATADFQDQDSNRRLINPSAIQ